MKNGIGAENDGTRGYQTNTKNIAFISDLDCTEYEMAINALEMMQKYKMKDCGEMSLNEAIQHLDELLMKNSWDCEECKNEHIQLRKWLNELLLYKAIGTISECQSAIEKQKKKQPKHQGCYDSNGIWHEWNGVSGKPYELCPNCGVNLCCEMPYDNKPKFCDNCGQALEFGSSNK